MALIEGRSSARLSRLSSAARTSTRGKTRIVPAITPRAPIRCTSTIESPRFSAAATIDSTPCSRVRFTAASRHDSTVMNPLITAHNAIAASNAVVGTAAAPAHSRMSAFPTVMRSTPQSEVERKGCAHCDAERASHPGVVSPRIRLGVGRPQRRKHQATAARQSASPIAR